MLHLESEWYRPRSNPILGGGNPHDVGVMGKPVVGELLAPLTRGETTAVVRIRVRWTGAVPAGFKGRRHAAESSAAHYAGRPGRRVTARLFGEPDIHFPDRPFDRGYAGADADDVHRGKRQPDG